MSEENTGRNLGLIAGLGPAATIHYYTELLRAHEKRGSVMRLLMIQADMPRVVEHVRAGQTAELAQYLAGLIASLRAGGAEIAVVPAVTPHVCAKELKAFSSLPLINILTATSEAAKARGFKRVAIFGTRFTVESDLFGQLDGVTVVRPFANEIDLIHNTYYGLATIGKGTPSDHSELTGIAHRLIERNQLDAIILAGTDLSTIFHEANTDFRYIDCARIHIGRIMEALFES